MFYNLIKLISILKNLGRYMFVVPSSFVLTEEELDELVECIN